MKSEYRGLSKRVQDLLKLPEGNGIEFKQSASGFEPAELVGFANSDHGGMTLIKVSNATCDMT
jgi:hypothetical protein